MSEDLEDEFGGQAKQRGGEEVLVPEGVNGKLEGGFWAGIARVESLLVPDWNLHWPALWYTVLEVCRRVDCREDPATVRGEAEVLIFVRSDVGRRT